MKSLILFLAAVALSFTIAWAEPVTITLDCSVQDEVCPEPPVAEEIPRYIQKFTAHRGLAKEAEEGDKQFPSCMSCHNEGGTAVAHGTRVLPSKDDFQGPDRVFESPNYGTIGENDREAVYAAGDIILCKDCHKWGR